MAHLGESSFVESHVLSTHQRNQTLALCVRWYRQAGQFAESRIDIEKFGERIYPPATGDTGSGNDQRCAGGIFVVGQLAPVSVLTKMDICPDQAAVARLRVPDAHALGCELDEAMPKRFHQLNNELARVIDEWSMVSFLELDVTDEDSMAAVLGHIDMAVQFGEDAEVKVRDFDPGD